jgi:hypothetical protein
MKPAAWILAAAVFPITTAAAPGLDLPPATETVTIRGLCDHWKAWRTPDRDLYVTCPGRAPPPGAVELRAFYT